MTAVNRGLFLDAEHRLKLREFPIPKPAGGELLVEIRANGICGSDVQFFKEGRLGNFEVTVPYIPGHEASGVVVGTGPDVKHFKEGDKVVVEPGFPCGRCPFCKTGRYNLCPDVIFLSAPPINGTFCDYITMPESFAHPIPEGMSFEKAAVAEPAAVAVHAVNCAKYANGAHGVIIGTGPIGLLTLQAFKAAGGGQVTCVDLDAKRLQAAKKLGADRVINLKDEDMPMDIGDVVFETAGSTEATAGLFSVARVGGTVVQVGWPGDNIVNMNIASFIEKELRYLGVNRYANAFPTAIQWLADGRISTDGIITHRFPLSRGPEAFRIASDNTQGSIKVIVYNSEDN
ncbi:MAG TPA: alcohol dehydrogenase catalytic domain-containing protein [Clostridia bacterium]|nr:alcohol dehydrogenase catalytic domain-containing protein [Clostridia bacterium]